MKTTFFNFRFGILLLSFILASFISSAWNARGHMVVASIAYRSLNDSLRNYYTVVLQQHPFYSQWQAEYKNLKNIPEGDFLFMKASIRPDVIRKSGSKDDHPKWHYITTKIDFEKGHDSNVQNKDENVLSAIQSCLDSLKNPATPIARKAVFLSWVIHLIGDVHQPLHCGSLYNNDHKDGDKGGNDIWIHFTKSNDTMRLHAFWDDLPGKGTPYLQIRKTGTKQLHHLGKKLQALANQSSSEVWKKESFELAVKFAYANGAIGTLIGTKDKKTAPVLLDESIYTKKAHRIAIRRTTLAGMRLANAL